MYNKIYNEALKLKEDAEFKLGLSKLDNSQESDEYYNEYIELLEEAGRKFIDAYKLGCYEAFDEIKEIAGDSYEIAELCKEYNISLVYIYIY